MKYRIKHRYPCYPGGGCIPCDGYFVQVKRTGIFGWTHWEDVKGFVSKRKVEELLKILEDK